MPIRFKLLGALSVPLLLLLGLVYTEVSGEARRVEQVRHQADLATAITGPQGVLTSVQNERNWTVVELIGAENIINLVVTGYDNAYRETDQAVEDFAAEVESRGGRVAQEFAPALEALRELEDIRQQVAAYDEPRSIENTAFGSEIFFRYADIIDPFFTANLRLAQGVDHAEMRVGAELVDLVSNQIEVIAEAAHLALTNLTLERDDILRLADLRDVFVRTADEVKVRADGRYRDVVSDEFPQGFTDEFESLMADALTTGQVDLRRALGVLEVEPDEDYTVFRDKVATILEDQAADLVGEAERSQLLFVVLALLVVAVTVAASYLIARSITRPLQALTEQATTMAHDRLPQAVQHILNAPLGDDVSVPDLEPIDVSTRDEVGDVVPAINRVQDSALELAVEQAVLRRNIADSFVNLGRRNQNLLGRQLDFITDLERNEANPGTLSDLFRLDHLATRMRRNAESLLVLAGIDPARTWAAPVRITDVIRAALGEVEDYHRVLIRSVEATTVLGGAAADVAHLVAELVENALVFSPPDQTVEIRGRSQPAGYTLAVVDAGLGMPPEDIMRANRRLAGAESFTIAPSKYLGHYVAGNLAARHDIGVQLHSPGGGYGTTATIHLPLALLIDPNGVGGAALVPVEIPRRGAPA